MPSAYDVIVYVITIIGVVIFGRSMVKFTASKGEMAIVLIPMCVICFASSITFAYLFPNEPIKYYIITMVINTILAFIFFVTMSKDNIGSLIFALLTQLNILFYIIYLSTTLGRLFDDSRIMEAFFRVVLFTIVILAFRHGLREKYRAFVEYYTKLKGWIILILIPIVFFCLFFTTSLYPVFIFDRPKYSHDIMLISGQVMIVFYASIFYTFGFIVENYKIKNEIETNKNKLIYWQAMLDNQQTAIENTKKIRHDLRHHNALLLNYLNSGKIEEAKAYLKQYVENDAINKPIHYTNDITINGLLTLYLAKAERLGILVRCDVKMLKEVLIKEIELTNILANLLENAMEACNKLGEDVEKFIDVSIYVENSLRIEIKNSCVDKVEFDKEGFPISTKAIKSGIGTRSVASIVEKFNGFIDYSANSGVFVARVVINNC